MSYRPSWYGAHEVTTMAELEDVGVREFRDHATRYLAGSKPLAILRHGRIIGFYIPVERDEEEVKRAVAHMGEVVSRVLTETGMSEEELVAALAPPT
jgi:hypothetical protein